MATYSQDTPVQVTTEDSDYGSDLDEATVDNLFSQAESQPLDSTVLESIEEPVILDDHGELSRPLARLAKIRSNLVEAIVGLDNVREALKPKDAVRQVPIEIEYDERNRSAFSPVRRTEDEARNGGPDTATASLEPEQPDTRTPMQRFRPRRPLSVTDLVSPAWCEQQYWYSLTKHGRVRKTEAMKQGSKVHKVLEEQVHTEVPVDAATKEDRFALRIWNIIQGLRTLQQTGLTRELEVWGVVDGEVVNGIIDEITTRCPDEDEETRMLEEEENAASNKRKRKPLPEDQRTLTDYLTGSPYASILEQQSSTPWLGTLHERPKTFYIVDVKTRQSKSLPPPGSQLRPTQYQLMLYHRLFSNLAANNVPAERIFERYSLDPDKVFSDVFLASMSSLDMGFPPSSSLSSSQPPPDLLSEVLTHNTLNTLWTLLTTTFATTIPPSSLSNLLTAEFRSGASGSLIGRRSFPFNPSQLDTYVADEVKWWRGERSTKGVEIEEAFKCRICEFREGCTWRAEKVEEGVRKARLRQEQRRKSEI